MPRGSGSNITTIGIKVTGLNDAIAAMDMLAAKLQSINSGPGFASLAMSNVPLYTPASGAPIMASGGGVLGPGGSGVSTGGGAALGPGALAPNPLSGQGVFSNGGFAPGNGHLGAQQTLNISNAGGVINIVVAGQTLPGGGGGYGGGTHTQFGGAGNGGGGGLPPLALTQIPGGTAPSTPTTPTPPPPPALPHGFVENAYNALRQQSPFGQGAGGWFLEHDLGKAVLQGGKFVESFLPAGAMDAAGAMVGRLSPWLAGAAVVHDAAEAYYQARTAAEMPLIDQSLRERSYRASGFGYDPIAQERDRRLSQIDSLHGMLDSLANTPLVRFGRFIDPAADYEYKVGSRAAFGAMAADAQGKYDQTKAKRDFLLYGGSLLPDNVDVIQNRRDLRVGSGMYSISQTDNARLFDYSEYGVGKDFGFTWDESNRSYQSIEQALTGSGYEAYQRYLMGGGDARGKFANARSAAILAGDWQFTDSAAPEYYRANGMNVVKATAARQADRMAILGLQAGQTGRSIAEAGISGVGSDITYLQATGGSYTQIAAAQASTGPMYDPVLSSLHAQLTVAEAAGNTLVAAKLRAQIQQTTAQQEMSAYTSQMTLFGGRDFVLGSAGLSAQNRLSASMYGSESDALGAFGEVLAVARRRQGLALEQSQSRFYSPEQRERFAAEAAQMGLDITYDLPRQRGAYQLGLRHGEIGVAAAGYGAASTYAQMYGGVSDVYGASVTATNTMRAQLALNQQELSGAFGPRTQSERLDLQARQIELTKALNVELENAKRNFASASLGVATFAQGMAAARGQYQMAYFGAAGSAATGLQNANVVAARATLAQAQKNFDAVSSLPADNDYRRQRAMELQSAKADEQAAIQGYAGLGYSPGLERQQMAGQFNLSAMNSMFAQYGTYRGTLLDLMGNVAGRGKELSQYRAAAMRDIDSDPTLSADERRQRKGALEVDFDRRKYGLASEALSYQFQLEQGASDRITASMVNGPSRSAFITPLFSNREAAGYMQTMTSIFGESGHMGVAARDYWKDRLPNLWNQTTGNITTPEGFLRTAMSFGGGGVLQPMHGGDTYGSGAVAKNAKIQQGLRMIADGLSELVGDGTPNQSVRGRSTSTIDDIANSIQAIVPAYATGKARQ